MQKLVMKKWFHGYRFLYPKDQGSCWFGCGAHEVQGFGYGAAGCEGWCEFVLGYEYCGGNLLLTLFQELKGVGSEFTPGFQGFHGFFCEIKYA